MRLSRLDLTRYGRFTDRSLDFPRPASGEPDLHIVYGANEAGKSTAFAAWLDMLYGIHPQTPYAFQHAYGVMRIGAVVDHDGQQVALTRIKAVKNPLLDGNGAPVPEAMIGGLTGGIDRAGYRSMFSLDKATLEQGGKDILGSKGNLGEMLFSASAGLAGLAETLAGLRRTAEEFHPGRREDHSLTKSKAALKALTEQRETLDVDVSRYRRLREAVSAAEDQHHEASTAYARAATELEAVRRMLAALPHLARLTEAETALADMPDLPPPPEGWDAELAGLDTEEAKVKALIGSTAEQAEALARILDGARPDPVALDIAEAVRTAGDLRSAYTEAVKDLPTRREEADRLARKLSGAARALGQPDRAARDLQLPADRLAALRDAVAKRRDVEGALRTARQEAQSAEDALAQAMTLLPKDAGNADSTAALTLLLDRLRERDPGKALRAAVELAAHTGDALARRLSALRPFRGDAAALAAQVPPTDVMLAALSGRIDRAQTALQAAEAEALRCAAVVAHQEVELAARSVLTGESEVAALRAEREALWSAHRQHLTEDTADAFEASMRRDDLAMAEVADRRAEAALHREKAAELGRGRAAAGAADAAWLSARQEATAAQAALHAMRNALSSDLPAGMGLADLRDWLVRRAEALAAAADHRTAEIALARATADHAEATAALAGLLGAANQTYDGLMALADARVRDAARTAALREAAARAEAEITRRRRDLDLVSGRAEGLSQEWKRLCADTWIDPDTPPVAAAAVLDGVAALDGPVALHEDLVHRIAAMEVNVAGFAAAVAPLATRLGIAQADPARAWDALCERVDAAETCRDTRQKAELDLTELAQKRQTLDSTLDGIVARRREMARFFGSDNPAQAGPLIRTAQERVVLCRDRDSALGSMAETLEMPPAEARAMAEATDRAALHLAAATLQGQFGDLDAARQDSHANLREARKALEAAGGDDAVARLDSQIATRTLELRDRAQAHLRLRFGLIALDHALVRYRETHRSAMLARASAAFAAITDGAYLGLAVQPDRDGERLVALPVGGGSKEAHQMSGGTETQLYLALRIAGFHEFAASRATVPFIADDILETFDDARAARTFARLAEMALVGQVIYLTHHRHLCDIALQACPTAQLQRLD